MRYGSKLKARLASKFGHVLYQVHLLPWFHPQIQTFLMKLKHSGNELITNKFHFPLAEGNLKLIVVRKFYPKNLENPPTQSCIAQRLEFHFAIDQKEEAQQLVLVTIFPAAKCGIPTKPTGYDRIQLKSSQKDLKKWSNFSPGFSVSIP